MAWPVREAWLAQVREPILDPELPIVDAHHHLWALPHDRYLLPEFLADLKPAGEGHNVVATVFAECGAMYRQGGPAHLRSLGEVEFANGIGAQAASGAFGPAQVCAVMFGSVDLALGEAAGEVLDLHVARAPERYRGVRPIVCADPHGALDPWPNSPEGLMSSGPFRAGARELARRGLTLDLWLFHHQIGEATALARALPDLTVILDHIGTPLGIGWYAGRQAEVFAHWKGLLAELATCPNVVVKLGGLNMHFNGFDWHERPLPPTSDELVGANRDCYLTAIDLFGPDRCLFESNFPMDKRSVGYDVLWNAHKKMAAGFTAAERTAMFSRVASRVYRLDPSVL